MRISDWSSDLCSSDLFLGDQLASSRDAAGFIASRILDDRDDFTAVNATLFIDVPIVGNGADLGFAELARRAGERSHDANLDGVGSDADRKSTRLNSSH